MQAEGASSANLLVAVLTGAIVGLLSFGGTVLVYWNQRRKLLGQHELSKRELVLKSRVTIAGFRHAWLGELRDLMATYISRVLAHGLEGEFLASSTRLSRDEFAEIIRLGTKIQLMMNPNDEHYDQLDRLVSKITRSVNQQGKEELDVTFFSKLDDDWLSICQWVLKAEWETLKSEIRQAERPTLPPIP